MISIIVPIFNVEKFLAQCIESIISISKIEIEVILVNDGSTDQSGKICDSYASRDSRVRVFHNQNMGVSRTRNFGIDNAKGDFILFIDSDDYLEKDFININLNEISDYDLVIWGLNEEFSGGTWKTHSYKPQEYHLSSLRSFYEEHLLGHAFWGPWAKLFKRDIIIKNNIQFDTSMSLGEDTIFLMEYLHYINSINVSNQIAYNYRFVPHSLSKAHKVDRDEKFFKRSLTEVNYLESRYGKVPVFREFLMAKYVNYLLLRLKSVYLVTPKDKEKIKEALISEKKTIIENFGCLQNLKEMNIPFAKKVIVFLIRFNPFLSLLRFQFEILFKIYKLKSA